MGRWKRLFRVLFMDISGAIGIGDEDRSDKESRKSLKQSQTFVVLIGFRMEPECLPDTSFHSRRNVANGKAGHCPHVIGIFSIYVADGKLFLSIISKKCRFIFLGVPFNLILALYLNDAQVCGNCNLGGFISIPLAMHTSTTTILNKLPCQ